MALSLSTLLLSAASLKFDNFIFIIELFEIFLLSVKFFVKMVLGKVFVIDKLQKG